MLALVDRHLNWIELLPLKVAQSGMLRPCGMGIILRLASLAGRLTFTRNISNVHGYLVIFVSKVCVY